MDHLAAIDAFRPSGDDWGELRALVEAAPLDLAAVPALLGVFARFPRHDGHGVMWSIVHRVEQIAGYAPLLVEHVTRSPTEMGITMLRRLVAAGASQAGGHELAPLIATLASRAPILDFQIPDALRDLRFVKLDAFRPPNVWDVDWAPLHAIVDELLASRDVAIVTPLLATLDRFATYDGFSPWWKIVNGLEALPGFPEALVASLARSPTRAGVTLLLRLLASGITTIGTVDVATLAASLL